MMGSLADFMEAEIKLLNTEKFGVVSGGYIRLKGYIAHAEFVDSDTVLNDALSRPIAYPVILKREDRIRLAMRLPSQTFILTTFRVPLKIHKEMDGRHS
jgi:hypothetical protein